MATTQKCKLATPVKPVHIFLHREWYHREMVFWKGLSVRGRGARPGDLIISGDLDEIPRPVAVQALRSCEWAQQPGYHDCAVLEGSFFYYSFSWYAGAQMIMHSLYLTIRVS